MRNLQDLQMVFYVVLSLSGLSNQIGVFFYEQNKNINPLELVIIVRK